MLIASSREATKLHPLTNRPQVYFAIVVDARKHEEHSGTCKIFYASCFGATNKRETRITSRATWSESSWKLFFRKTAWRHPINCFGKFLPILKITALSYSWTTERESGEKKICLNVNIYAEASDLTFEADEYGDWKRQNHQNDGAHSCGHFDETAPLPLRWNEKSKISTNLSSQLMVN